MSYQMRNWQYACVQLNHENLVAGSTVQQHTALVLPGMFGKHAQLHINIHLQVCLYVYCVSFSKTYA